MASKKLLTADFAIEGYKPNDRAGLWFVPLTDIAAGTEIVFSNFAKRSLAAAMTSPSYVAAANIAAGTITAAGPAANAPTALIFIDSRVGDLQTLVDGARPGTQVWVLNANFDGVQQIVEMLQSSGLHGLDSIHIVSHGAQGEVQLGATALNAGNLAAHAHQLAEIGATLTADGDLLLYGCDVAGGNAGLQFIADLAHATGADVAASTDATGSNAAGGDWVLEAGTGSIEAPAPFAPETLNSFSGVLANETFTVAQATTLKTDIDGDGLADPGDTVTTSVTITNNSTNTNAANVSFNETLVGMTQQGAVKVTPIAANDGGYTLVGNTPITFNAAQGVLANDVDPNGAGGNAGLTAINVVTDANTHGTVVLNSDGSFTYTPTTGYTGAATFQYTARDVEGLNSNQTGVVTLTVTDPVWYVDSASAPAGADGSFLRPFQTLAQATAVDTANDTIFVYNRGANYTQATGITLEAGEQLLGDGSSLTTVNGNAVGASAVNSTFVVTGNSINALTLGSSNTLSGINISGTGTAGNGIVSAAGGVGTLHLISVGVTTTGNGIVLTTGGTVDAAGTNTINSSGGTALNVTNTNIGASHLTFQSISAGTGANTASNGIVLNNTGAAGGLHVTGTGTAGSGGTIQHMTGADGNTGSGIGILLINTSGVQLDRMQLNDFQNFAILGNTVNGFTLANSTINGVNGASTGVAEGSVRFIQLTGTAAITNSTISATTTGTTHVNDTLHIENTSGTLNMTISGSTIANLLSSGANHAIFFGAPSGNGTMNLTMTGSNVTAAYQDLLRGDFQGNTTASINISGSQFRNTSEMTAGGTAGVTTNLVDLTGGGTSAASGVFVTYNISNNTFAHGDGVNAPLVSGGSSAVRIGEGSTVSSSFADFVGIFSGNTIGVSGVARSGAGNGADGLSVIHYRDETTAHGGSQVLIQNNTIQNYGEAGIKVGAQDGKLSADNDGSLDATIFGNIIRQPGAINDGAFAGIWGYAGNSVGDENVLNLVIGDALAAGNKNTLTNSDPNNSFDVFLGNVGIATAPINLSRNGSGSGTVNNATEAQVNAVLTADNVGPLDLTGNTVSPINLVTTLPVRPLFADTSIPAPDTASGSNPSPAPDTQPVPAADTTANPGAVASQLAQTDLDNIVAAAILRWNATGLTADQQAYLYSVQFSVADMQGLFLGSAAPGHIIIDSDAAGYGWFLDATPSDDAEFGNVLSDSRVQANPGQLPNGHIDLLTAVMHELSHQLGLHDTYDPADRDSISYGYLVTGERRLPEAGQALGAIAGSIDHEEFAVGPVAIGTLPFGKSVTISFDATIDAQNNQLIVNPVNQGTVSGTAPFPAATNSNSVTTTLDTLTLGGTVWNDNGAGGGATGNGLKDGTEPGVDGVLLSLFADANNDNTPDSPGAPLATATTAGGGNYAFTGLAPGNYIVRVDQDNFDAGGNMSLLGLQSSSLGNPDPDNSVDNDDNGSRVVGQPAFTQAITLAYNTEPTAGTGNDTNTTLDLGFRIYTVRADLNGDSKSDILLRHDNGRVYLWGMDGYNIASGGEVATLTSDWKIAEASGDFNGDGKSDILLQNDNGRVYLWQMDGNNIVSGGDVATLTTDWKIAEAAGDYNADGKRDILLRNDNGRLYLWQMDGNNIASGGEVGTLTADWKIAEASGDYNGDGRSDILLRNDNGRVYLWQMDGNNIATGGDVAALTSDWKIADAAGDYDGDGKSDILLRNDNGRLYLWQMDGNNIAGGGEAGTLSADWKIAKSAVDYNSDGSSDLILRNDNGRVYEWQMDGVTVIGGGDVATLPTEWSLL